MEEEEQQQPEGSRRNWIFQLIFKTVVLHLVISLFTGSQRGKVDPSTGKSAQLYHNFLGDKELYDVYVYVTPDGRGDFQSLESGGQLVFSAENQVYSHKLNRAYEVTTSTVSASAIFFNEDDSNLYATVFLVPHKAYSTRATPFYKSEFKDGFDGHMVVETVALTTMRTVKKSKEVNLVGNNNDEDEGDGEGGEMCKHWIPRLDVNVVYDVTPRLSAPGDVYFEAHTKYPEESVYDPLLYLSQFWVLEEHYQCIKPTMGDEGLNLSIHFSTCSPSYYMFSTQFKLNSETGGILGTQSAKEFEMFKRTLMTTNIYMLLFSGAFIMLHSVFSFFALKNDIQFWHKNDSMEGLSALSVVINFVCDIIIALYIFDSEHVSWLVLFEIAIGVVASAWKVSKAIRITLTRQFPYIQVGNARNYVESNTKKYDKMAIKYMSIVMLPCIMGYAVYSLLYHKHKSWYSYLISVAAGSVYTFGFIMMTPQIYINYKLKSVDHLPWRALIYKSLNTFVDDVASFLIDMPWMHRLSCFRDDIIFFCYLYQRWAYRVDPSRPNAWNTSPASQEIQDEDKQESLDAQPEAAAENVTNLDEHPTTGKKSSKQPTRRK
ncbi:transmembrane CLPTM1 family protein [Babesia divergens]|uniref:Transmembrane CLPTM1 family protein n=1 Tax=Babesia divergens TaxID=32595 RepID=A0AAD9GCV6_BABDI|nr:transmembrane CLPTM1 family protein [Babesia divergens]